MNLSRWLELHTALLAVLGAAFLLLAGDRTPFPWALAVAAVVAVVVTDWYGWLKVPRALGNLAALVAVAWTFREFWRYSRDREAQLLTISHMLIYLQVVLLFQVKSRRVHWQLMVLSVLQVVVAAALALGPQFGLLLIAYVSLSIGSMLLLCWHREVVTEQPQEAKTKSPLSLHRLLDPPRVVVPERNELKLLGAFRSAWLVRGVAMFALASVVFTALFFVAAPRSSEALWQSARGRTSVSGFSEEVVLRSTERIELSDQPVLRASFMREDNRRPVVLTTEPYFHGQTLTHYQVDEIGAGHWSAVPRQPRGIKQYVPAELEAGNLVRQEIVLEMPQSRLLFALRPFVPLADTPKGIRPQARLPRLMRQLNDDQLIGREYRYVIGTLAIRNGRQVHAVPHYIDEGDSPEVAAERYEMQQFSADRFPGLKRIADEVIQERKLQHEPVLPRALALQGHLFGSGQYEYSLSTDANEQLPPDQAQLDPLERFVVHGRRGHCEYFASALVMMLRSQGIPARLVVGYKGGDWNPIGKYYLVRQKHAHAWAEVFLSAEEVPADEIAGVPSAGGAWFRLDPTPLAPEILATNERHSMQGRVANLFDYADYLWRDYVLGMNATRQETVLEPLTGRSRDLFGGWLESSLGLPGGRENFRQNRADRSKGEPHGGAAGAGTGQWLILTAGFALLALGPALLGLLGLLIRSGASVLKRRSAARENSAPSVWREVEHLLRQKGVEGTPHTTAEEWAAAAGRRLTLPADRDLPVVLQTIVSSYHRMRFGSGRLSPREEQDLARALALLRQARPGMTGRPATSGVNPDARRPEGKPS